MQTANNKNILQQDPGNKPSHKRGRLLVRNSRNPFLSCKKELSFNRSCRLLQPTSSNSKVQLYKLTDSKIRLDENNQDFLRGNTLERR